MLMHKWTRTGEILNAQIFLTSAFAIGGKEKAKKIVRKILQKNNPNKISFTNTEDINS